MKRLTSKNGKEIYGQKWQITESSSDSKIDEDLHSALLAKSSATAQMEAAKQESPTIPGSILKGKKEGSRMDERSMYRAALDGDWLAAEVLLGRDPTLASKPISEKGDRALHIAAAMMFNKFVGKLVERMSEDELELVDGRGYTACCYAPTSGVVEIACFMINKSPKLIPACYRKGVMPLHMAANRGKKEAVSYFLKITKIEDMNEEQWFDLLLIAIRRNMFGVAMEIVEANTSLAAMANQEGTALHLLARKDTSNVIISWKDYAAVYLGAIEAPSFNRLATKLWALMQQTKNDSQDLLELITKHHILHDAARTGHAELVTMIISTCPHLIWETDGNKHTLFHVAIKHRQYGMLSQILRVEALIGLCAESQDEDGNNIMRLIGCKISTP